MKIANKQIEIDRRLNSQKMFFCSPTVKIWSSSSGQQDVESFQSSRTRSENLDANFKPINTKQQTKLNKFVEIRSMRSVFY